MSWWIFLLVVPTVSAYGHYQKMPPIGKLGFELGFPSFPKMGRFPSPFDEKGEEEEFQSLFKGASKPVPGVNTKVHNETKGNTTVYTVEQKGKGYHSFSQFSVSKNNPSMITEGFSEDIQSSGNDEGETRAQAECGPKKPCPQDQFCNPVASVCGKKIPLKGRCQFKDQCEGTEINCIWGKCRKAKAGSPGSLCQKDSDCQGDAFCSDRYEISPFYDVCALKLDEGAACGTRRSGVTTFFGSLLPFSRPGGLEAKTKTRGNPCKEGLVCEPVGLTGTLTCIPAN